MSETDAAQRLLAGREAIGDRLAGAGDAWVRGLRDAGLARFRRVGLPTQRDENWKYTSLRPLEKLHFEPVQESAPLSREALEQLGLAGLTGPRLVFVDGRLRPELSTVPAAGAGLTVTSLAQRLERDPQSLAPFLGRCMPAEPHGFAALNSAWLADGAVVEVAAGARLEAPVELLFIAVAGDERDARVSYPRNLVLAGRDSRAILVERYVAAGEGPYLTNAVTEVIVDEQARLEHYRLQLEALSGFHVGCTFARVARDAHYVSHAVAMGGRLARTDLIGRLVDEGGRIDMNGLYLATGRQHIDSFTRIDHAQPRGTSREFYKGIVDGRGRAVFHGRIVVHEHAQGTDAQQQNRNLLLSRDAEVDTKPQLEIYADDVKCAHGATVGQLAEDALFYLRSRGVDEETARSLLTWAFANDVLGRFGLEAVRGLIEEMITARLLQGRHLEELV